MVPYVVINVLSHPPVHCILPPYDSASSTKGTIVGVSLKATATTYHVTPSNFLLLMFHSSLKQKYAASIPD
jgi:hypothetical protein